MKPDSKWIKKVSNKCLVILNAFSVIKVNVWHLDSGGYRHMTRDKISFLSLARFNVGDFVFDCGDKSQISKNRVVNIRYLPQLKNVNYVDGLKSSLICIYMLCDKVADEVSLSIEGCQIVDKFGKNMLAFRRFNDKCYILDAYKISEFSKFNLAIDETNMLFHRRRRHVNIKDLHRLSKKKVVRGLPHDFISDFCVYGLCFLGKQTKAAHKELSTIGTSMLLQVMSMNLVGPILPPYVNGNHLYMLIVDVYFMFIWVWVLREKSNTSYLFLTEYKVTLNESMSCSSTPVKIKTDHVWFVSQFDLKYIKDFLTDEKWISAVQEKPNHLENLLSTPLVPIVHQSSILLALNGDTSTSLLRQGM